VPAAEATSPSYQKIIATMQANPRLLGLIYNNNCSHLRSTSQQKKIEATEATTSNMQ
jgi:hypothetical protein